MEGDAPLLINQEYLAVPPLREDGATTIHCQKIGTHVVTTMLAGRRELGAAAYPDKVGTKKEEANGHAEHFDNRDRHFNPIPLRATTPPRRLRVLKEHHPPDLSQ